MQIIIAGLGKVGMCLAGELIQEGHELSVVDIKPASVQKATSAFDIMGISGNAADPDTLAEIEAGQADLFIAVTTNDETNLLSCLLAKRAGCSKTIARVRNPEYSSSMDYLKEALGLEMIINPEQIAAEEIERVLSLPGAIDVDSFSAHKGEILKLRINSDSLLDGMRVRDIPTSIRCDVLVCIVERGKEIFIPDGSFEIHGKDYVYIAGARQEVERFFKSAGIPHTPIRNVMAVGAGRLAHYVSERLEKQGIRMTVIDKDPAACEKMALLHPKTIVIEGDASVPTVLLDEGLEETDAFLSLTGLDEENIFLSLFAQRRAGLKTVTKVTHISLDDMFTDIELDTLINPKLLSAEYIIRQIRALDNTRGSSMKTIHKLAGDRVEALEFEIGDQCPLLNVPLMEMPIKSGVLVALIERDSRLFLPRGADCLKSGDLVVIITNRKGFCDICDIVDGRRRAS